MQVPPESIRFDHYNGTIALFSPHLPSVYDAQSQLHSIPGHITLITAEEYKFLKRPLMHTIISTLAVDHVYCVGEGSSRDGSVNWECVIWNEGHRWRVRMGLGKRDFHVTTSSRDDHHLDKSIGAVLNKRGMDGMMDHWRDLSVEGMYEVIISCQDVEMVRHIAGS